MGLINFGIPLQEANFLREEMSLNIAIEGGTFTGGTAKKLSHYFSDVLTIEKSDSMLCMAKQNLKDIKNITILKGDTRSNLPVLLSKYDNILFWLDAHWSGGGPMGKTMNARF